MVKITAPTLNTHLTSKLYVDTALIGKQNTLTASSDVIMNALTASSAIVNSVDIGSGFSSLQIQVDALINFTGGGVNFRAIPTTTVTTSAGNNLPYNLVDFDTENSYDTNNSIYTIVIGGTYVFTFQILVNGSDVLVNLTRKRDGVVNVIQQLTNGTNTFAGARFTQTAIAEVETGDEIFCYVQSGSCDVISALTYGGTTPFSGSRISN